MEKKAVVQRSEQERRRKDVAEMSLDLILDMDRKLTKRPPTPSAIRACRRVSSGACLSDVPKAGTWAGANRRRTHINVICTAAFRSNYTWNTNLLITFDFSAANYI